MLEIRLIQKARKVRQGGGAPRGVVWLGSWGCWETPLGMRDENGVVNLSLNQVLLKIGGFDDDPDNLPWRAMGFFDAGMGEFTQRGFGRMRRRFR